MPLYKLCMSCTDVTIHACIKNQDIYLLKCYTSVSSKPSKHIKAYLSIYLSID